RHELDDTIRDSLGNFTAALEQAMARNGIGQADLVAVVSVGGGANLPAVTTMISGRLRVPVVSTPRPQLTPAVGGALRASRGPDGDSATAAPPPTASGVPRITGLEEPRPALAWSEADDESQGG